jgi:hypothetical protein
MALLTDTSSQFFAAGKKAVRSNAMTGIRTPFATVQPKRHMMLKILNIAFAAGVTTGWQIKRVTRG